jgi:NifU-like protein involved in Fe-S cluster formation
MELRVDDGMVTAARFAGDSCAICTASADVVAERVAGRPVSEAATVDSGTILDILDADVRPTRMRCVLLPISVLRRALGVPGETR